MPEHSPPTPPDLEAAFVDGLTRFIGERELAEEAIEQLGEAPFAILKEEVRRLAAEAPWPVTAALLRLARSAAESNPSREVVLARLALLTAFRVRLPEPAKAGLRAEALALLGDGFRRQHKLTQAEEALARAARHLAKSADPHLKAFHCTLLAHLREDQGRPEDALVLRSRAARLFGEIGQVDDQAEVLLQKAALEFQRDDVKSAEADLQAVIALADKGLRSDLAGLAVLVYGRLLQQRRRTAEALSLLGAFHQLYRDLGVTMILADLHLLEGMLLIFSDRPEVAEARLEAARREFLEVGEPLAAAAACMSLCMLYLLDGRRAADLTRLLAEALGPIVQSPYIPPPILEGFERFRAEVEAGAANAGLAGAFLRDIEAVRERRRR